MLAGEDRVFGSSAGDIVDQELLGRGTSVLNAGGTDKAHLTTNNVTGFLIESFAADCLEAASFGIEDFDSALTERCATQTNWVLTSQSLARGCLLRWTHASSV